MNILINNVFKFIYISDKKKNKKKIERTQTRAPIIQEDCNCACARVRWDVNKLQEVQLLH